LASILLVFGKTSSFNDPKKLDLTMEIIFNVTITNYSKKGKERLGFKATMTFVHFKV